MQVICISEGWCDSTNLIPCTKYPEKGKTYTVISTIISNFQPFYLLKGLERDETGKPQVFASQAFEIIDDGIGDRAPKDYLKPSMPPLPPVIVGIPGT